MDCDLRRRLLRNRTGRNGSFSITHPTGIGKSFRTSISAGERSWTNSISTFTRSKHIPTKTLHSCRITTKTRNCISTRHRTDSETECANIRKRGKIRGRLGFTQSLLFGRFGKALLQPITQRQYTRFRKKPQLNAQLRYCIKWWIATLQNPINRSVPLTPRPTIAVYSDAAGNGRLGVFIAHGDSYTFAHTHTPKWFTGLNLQIYELETCATLLAITLAEQLSGNATIILRVDNTGTQNVLINGRADNPVVNQIVATFWQVEARKTSQYGWKWSTPRQT